MNKIRLAVLFGGVSSEYEVSCVSASSVLDNLDKDKYEIYKIGITKDGRWFLTMADTAQIKDGRWADRKDNISAVISPDRGCRGLLLLKERETESIRIDCIYPVVHGKNCEDGAFRAFRHTLCGTRSCGFGMQYGQSYNQAHSRSCGN